MARLKWLNEYDHNSATLLNSVLNLEIHLVLALILTFSKYFYDVVIFILTWCMIALIEYCCLITTKLQYKNTKKKKIGTSNNGHKRKKHQVTEVRAILHKKTKEFPLHLKFHNSWLSKAREGFYYSLKIICWYQKS